MADGTPPKPADGTDKPVTESKDPVKETSAAPAADGSGAVAPEASALKKAIDLAVKPQPLPGVEAVEASAVKQAQQAAVEAKPETKTETPTEKTAGEKTADDKKPEEKKKSFKIKMFEKGVDAAGFGEILKAWRSPNNRFRNVMKSIGTKAADMVAGRIVSMTFRLIAITWVAGIIGGVSTFGGLALLALATGAASGIYSYGKDYLHDRFYGPKEKRADVKFIDKARLRSAGISFATGTFNGALGAWLAKTGILQNLFGMAKDFITTGGGLLSQKFNDSVVHTATDVATSVIRTPNLGAAFSVAAAPTIVEPPRVELAFAPNAVPKAISPAMGFKAY